MISIHVVTKSKKYNITNMVKDVTWAGDINTLPRQLDVNFHNTNDIEAGKKLVNVVVGDQVIAYNSGSEIFRGVIFKTSIDQSGSASFTAYDELVYVTKNTDSILIKNKSATQVIKEQCKKFGISYSSIEDTKVKISKLVCQDKTLADTWQEALEETKKKNGKSYKIYSSKGKVYMKSRANATKLTVSITDVISASNETSIEELKTQVMVTKGSLDPTEKSDTKFQYVIEKDKTAASKYGVMQHVENVDDKAKTSEMRTKAKQVLKTLNKPDTTLQIEFIGNVSCTTGNQIKIKDPLTGISGTYYITSDSHSWSNGVHKMSLQISKTIE